MIIDYKILVSIEQGYKYHKYIIRQSEVKNNYSWKLYDITSDENHLKEVTETNKDIRVYLYRIYPDGSFNDLNDEETISLFCGRIVSDLQNSFRKEKIIDNYKYTLLSEYKLYN